MLASTRQQRRASGSNSPPTWVTSSPLADGGWEDAYSQTLLAVDADAPITYGVATGSLPPGVTLNGLTGVVSGTPSPNPDAPTWATPAGNLGTGTQGSSFSVDLDAPGVSIFTISSCVLPWGLTLNVATGLIDGTLSVIGGAEDPPGPPPVWVTAAGDLGTVRTTYNGAFPVSFAISATGATFYEIVSGGLPWGVTLNRATGALTGFAAYIGSDGTWEPDTVVTWSAPASTNLGSFARGASIGTITQTSSLAAPFYITAGELPWGLTMARGSGAFSGTVSNEARLGLHTFTVSCAPSNGYAFGQRTYSITITDPPITMSAWDDGTDFSDGTGWV